MAPIVNLKFAPTQIFAIAKSDTEQAMQLKISQPTRDAPLPLHEAQERVHRWIEEVGVNYFSELTNLAQLVEEVGELARIISRTYGDQSFKESEQNASLSDELADVLFVLICLSNQTGVDLSVAFKQNIEKKTQRDFQRHQTNPKLKPTNQQD